MRRLAEAALVCVAIVAARGIGQASDERNVRVLGRHLGCGNDVARRLYVLARREGYGAAYARVFPGQAIPGIRPF